LEVSEILTRLRIAASAHARRSIDLPVDANHQVLRIGACRQLGNLRERQIIRSQQNRSPVGPHELDEVVADRGDVSPVAGDELHLPTRRGEDLRTVVEPDGTAAPRGVDGETASADAARVALDDDSRRADADGDPATRPGRDDHVADLDAATTEDLEVSGEVNITGDVAVTVEFPLAVLRPLPLSDHVARDRPVAREPPVPGDVEETADRDRAGDVRGALNLQESDDLHTATRVHAEGAANEAHATGGDRGVAELRAGLETLDPADDLLDPPPRVLEVTQHAAPPPRSRWT
jgi:hypothetical protein